MVKKFLQFLMGIIHVCKARVIQRHFVDEQSNIQQSAVQLMLTKSLTGEEVAHQLITRLFDYLPFHRDRYGLQPFL